MYIASGKSGIKGTRVLRLPMLMLNLPLGALGAIFTLTIKFTFLRIGVLGMEVLDLWKNVYFIE